MGRIENLLKMPWEYEFENEWTTNGFNLKEPLDRYFIFKATIRDNQSGHIEELKETEEFCKKCFSEYGDIVDFDHCELAIDLYKRLWGIGDRTDYYYTIENFKSSFGGDTMNSVQTPLSELLTSLCQSENGKKYEEERKYGKDKNISYKSTMYVLKLYKRFKDELLNDIRKAADIFEEYVRAYHTLGNFVLVPEGFNKFRGTNNKLGDYWDRSLNYLKDGECKEFEDDFAKYVNYFFLWDYVKPDYSVKPLSPKNNDIDAIKKFFVTATDLIKRRGKFMTAMLMIQTQNPSLYKDIQTFLTNGKFSAESIFDAAKKILENSEPGRKIPENAKNLFDELKEGIV